MTIFDDDDTEDWFSDRFMPMFEPATYEMASLRESRTGVLIVGNYAYYHYAPPSKKEERNDFTEPNKLGIFSTDYFFDGLEWIYATRLRNRLSYFCPRYGRNLDIDAEKENYNHRGVHHN